MPEFKKHFDQVLARVLHRKIRETHTLTRDPYVRLVAEYPRTLLLAGGKRVRPYLAYLGYMLAERKTQSGKTEKEVMEALVGLELFHAFALVHDDIMDRGTSRHGVATANKRFGDAQAILVGDLLFHWSWEILAPTTAREIFTKMVNEVIIGQMLDVDAVRRSRVSDEFIAEKMRLKTAMYSFVRPMQVGAALSQNTKGKRQNFLHFAESFGLALGLAFQIQDDLLDLTATSSNVGKSVMNDVREGQKTVFTQYASRDAKNRLLLNRMKGKKMTVRDRKRLKQMFEESGANVYGIEMMETLFDEAERVVWTSGLSKKRQVPFLEMVEYIRARSN